MRVPHELVKRNFKNQQRYLEREQTYLLPALKDAANASVTSKATTEQTLASLDDMIARMQTFKRKLDTLHTEEETLHDHTSKRIRHVQELFEMNSLSDVNYDDWSRTRLDRLVVDYLLRSGHQKTAESLATAKNIAHLIDLDVFTACHKIADSLTRGETKEALQWIAENRAALKKVTLPPFKTSDLEFQLRFQQFIELIRANKIVAAQEHAALYLSPQHESRPDLVLTAAGLLAQSANTDSEPYRTLFSAVRWPELADLFIKTHHTLMTLPTQPLLHVAMSAGLSALKTPACHSKFNPASSSTPGHVRIATNTSLCPICSTELNDLARNVPYAHHTVSSVDPEPVVLPNGRVYGRAKLEDLQRKFLMASGSANAEEIEIGKDGELVDPTTGEKFGWHEVKKVYIT